jgi:hypothetical protein
VPRQEGGDLLVDRRSVLGKQGVGVAGADEARERLVGGLGARLVAGGDLDLAAAQAGGDLERGEVDPGVLSRPQGVRDRRLGDPEQAQDPGAVGGGGGRRGAESGSPNRCFPHRPQLARGPGEHDDGGPLTVRGRNHQPWRGTHRGEHGRAFGDHCLLAVRMADRLGVEPGPAVEHGRQDLADARLESRVEDHLAPGEAPHDLGREVVRGRPEAAAGDDQVETLGGHEGQRGQDVPFTVADDDDVRGIDADLAQALGQPGAVAVGDDPAQDLGAGDEDSGARAHPQFGAFATGSGWYDVGPMSRLMGTEDAGTGIAP